MSDEERIDDISVDENDSESDMETKEEDEEEVEDMTEEETAKLAEEKKLQGNNLYKEKSYQQALSLYTEAIDLCPTCAAFYGNRSATYMMLGRYVQALEDARRATSLDPTFVKGYLREGKCHLAMGEIVAALRSYEKVLEMEPNNTTAKNELNQVKTVQQHVEASQSSYDKGDFRRVVYCMDRCIELSPDCKKFRVLKAESLALLKRYQESQEMANDILRSESTNADAIYVRGLCLYYQDNVEKAFQHFQQVLRLAPDHQKARDAYRRAKLLNTKKEEGNKAFRCGKLTLAHQMYSEALEIDPLNVFTNSKLYCNRATVCSKLSKLDDAIADCSKAVELDDTYLKAYLRRAKCYTDREMFEEAVRDYEKVYKMDKTRENKQFVHNAKIELKKSKRKDYYKILGVPKSANEDEMKKAYRKRALLHHPDRHSNATDEAKKEEEKKFKEIGEAYAILSDPKKKARFDNGQDLDDADSGFGDFDPNTIFQTFFGGPGGSNFMYQGGGGHGHSHGGGQQHFQQQGGGFPGGFTFQFG